MINNRLRNFFSKLKSGNLKSIATMFTGTLISRVIPFLLAPVLTRIYTQEEFGRVALYLSVTQVFSVIACGRYEMSIVLPENKKEALSSMLLSVIIAFFTSFVLFVIVILFSTSLSVYLEDPKIEKWLYFLPLSIFLQATFMALSFYMVREKKFKDIAVSNIAKTFGAGLLQILLGVVKKVYDGLLIGEVFSYLFGNFRYLKQINKEKEVIKSITKKDLKSTAKRYKNFALFSTPSILLNSLSVNVINFFIPKLYSLSVLGNYSLSYKYIMFPITLIGGSVRDVFFQELNQVKHEQVKAKKVFIKYSLFLFISSFIICTVLYFIIEDLFMLVFGKEWQLAGEISKILLPLVMVRFCVNPISVVLMVYEKQKMEFVVNSLLFLAGLGAIAISSFFKHDISMFVTIFMILNVIIYIIVYFLFYKVIRDV
ncbi:oligosaccharide flippase family protein [Flavobacterium sp. ST-75]|uniref:Oligosaccharide flippase family protein n=1 Tax=Flavobacterium rhizophilum TaxID=3163296 RepID=A0ABW8Y954_9FLAO